MRILSALMVAALGLFSFTSCIERHYRFVFHKDQVSQDQLLQDQATLRKKSGVIEVFTTAHPNGSGSIEVETKDGKDIQIQQLLTSMGYTRGQH